MGWRFTPEPYAAAFRDGAHRPILAKIAETASRAREAGLVVNAGHDLNLHNIPPLMQAVPFLAEASIGHELTADALENGFRGDCCGLHAGLGRARPLPAKVAPRSRSSF